MCKCKVITEPVTYFNFVVLDFASQIEYADALPDDMFFVSVHKGNYIVGDTKEGCNFMQKAGYFIPSLFMGYLSSHSGN